MISFRCESCGKAYKAADTYAGKRIRCSGCKQPLTVPPAAAPAEVSATSSTVHPAPPENKVATEKRFERKAVLSYARLTESTAVNWGPDTLLALGGGAMLVVGVFVPLISAPVIGSVNYFSNGRGEGAIVLGLGICALVLAFLGRLSLSGIAGVLAAGLTTFSLIQLLVKMSDVKQQAQRDMAGNPFAGLGRAMVESIQLQWGWAVLYLGATALVVSALMSLGVVSPRAATASGKGRSSAIER